jgi:hypothetical protein
MPAEGCWHKYSPGGRSFAPSFIAREDDLSVEVKNTMIYHFYGFCTLVRCREEKNQKSADVACPNVGLSIDSHA